MGNIEGCTWSSAVVVVSRVKTRMSESMQLATPLSLVGATDTATPNTYLASNRRRRRGIVANRRPFKKTKKRRNRKETKQTSTSIPHSSCCAVLCCAVAWREARVGTATSPVADEVTCKYLQTRLEHQLPTQRNHPGHPNQDASPIPLPSHLPHLFRPSTSPSTNATRRPRSQRARAAPPHLARRGAARLRT
jgi:hypothetical protein